MLMTSVADVVVSSNAFKPSTATNMDTHRLSKIATTVNMALFLFVLVAVTSSVVTGSRYYDDIFPVVERRAGNPACRRCALNRHDWSSCTACFRYARRGSGRIPYYGLRKRSSLDDDVMVTPDDVIECCAVTGNPQCCRQVEYRRSPASVARLEPRYLPILASEELINSGPVCSCCEAVLYDAVCCQAGCDV